MTITINARLTGLLLMFLFAIPSPAKPQAGTGTVKGEIRLPNGEPASGVRVSAMRVTDRMPGTEIVLEHIVETSRSGQYSLTGISPGRYYIVAGAIQALTYYPGSNSAQAARILTIEADSSLNAVPFYERAGFRSIERRVHRVDAAVEIACVRMLKNLIP